MSEYGDLTPYVYFDRYFGRQSSLNVGWLGRSSSFKQREPIPQFLDLLWRYCAVSVADTRGLHECELCQHEGCLFTRNGSNLLLGSAEIRVFARDGTIFASPNLIYHYVEHHRYLPPAPFLEAIQTQPAPPSDAYFETLKSHAFDWRQTSAPSEEPRGFRFG